MTRTDIPDELVAAMRGAAGAVLPHPGDLAGVQRRGRARRRRRAAAVAGVAAVVVAAAIAVPSMIAGRAAPPVVGPPVVDPPPAAPAEPAQRLLIDGAGWVMIAGGDGEQGTGAEEGETARAAYERLRKIQGAAGVLGALAEVRPDDEVVDLDLDLPGIDSVREVAAMPDGRLAAIGIVDRMPGVQREDGPCVEGVDFPLLVIEADGSVSLHREVWVRCQTLLLIAADADTAYLARDSQLVAHDLATGEERVLVDSAEALGSPGAEYWAGRASVGGDRLATAAFESSGEECQQDRPNGRIVVRATEFEGGVTNMYPLPASGCVGWPGPVRVSPDGHYAAVAYHRPLASADDRSELWLAVLDLDTGELAADEPVVAAAEGDENARIDVGPYRISSENGAIAGMAWDDERTLRVAWYEVPEEGVHWISEVVEVTTLSVP